MGYSGKAFRTVNIVAITILCSTLISQIPTDGLVAHWPFDGNIADSAASYDLTGSGAITFEEGIRGQSVRIQNSAYLSTSEMNSFYTGATPFSISFWYKTSSLVNWSDAIFSLGKTGNPGLDITYKQEYIQVRRFIWGVTTYTVQTAYDPYPDHYSYVDGLWHHIVMSFDGTATSLYVDGNFIEAIDSPASIGSDNPLFFGVERPGIWPCNGNLDDAYFYSRAVTSDEARILHGIGSCSEVSVNDTTIYHVSDTEFQGMSPLTVYNNSDSLKTSEWGCDSIVNSFSRFIFEPYYYTDTVEVLDTTWVSVNDTTFITVTDSVAVTDTLIIDVVLSGLPPDDDYNTIKVYPNPAREQLYINTGDYSSMAGYRIEIVNMEGTKVFETNIEEPLYTLNLSDWTGYGLYLIQIKDAAGKAVTVRKIILE